MSVTRINEQLEAAESKMPLATQTDTTASSMPRGGVQGLQGFVGGSMVGLAGCFGLILVTSLVHHNQDDHCGDSFRGGVSAAAGMVLFGAVMGSVAMFLNARSETKASEEEKQNPADLSEVKAETPLPRP